MPIIISEDKKGKYIKWGKQGKRYYYNTSKGFVTAYSKAMKQMRAIAYSYLK